jgi:hypothetical protein
MDEWPWHLTDPERTLRDIEAWFPFELDRVIVAAVELDTQRVTDVRVAATGTPPEEYPCGSDLVRALAEDMIPERWAAGRERPRMTHVLVTVVCREGRVVFTSRENAWHRAWRYSNHLRAAFQGDVYVVTPHGWGGSVDERAGLEPRLSPRLSCLSTQPAT